MTMNADTSLMVQKSQTSTCDVKNLVNNGKKLPTSAGGCRISEPSTAGHGGQNGGGVQVVEVERVRFCSKSSSDLVVFAQR